jgi:hypothetical protein
MSASVVSHTSQLCVWKLHKFGSYAGTKVVFAISDESLIMFVWPKAVVCHSCVSPSKLMSHCVVSSAKCARLFVNVKCAQDEIENRQEVTHMRNMTANKRRVFLYKLCSKNNIELVSRTPTQNPALHKNNWKKKKSSEFELLIFPFMLFFCAVVLSKRFSLESNRRKNSRERS